MSKRLSKIVTKTGDQGMTGLADGSRLLKNDIRIHCLGETDELNTMIGLLINFVDLPQVLDLLQHIQHDLFDVGAELSQPGIKLLSKEYVEYLDEEIETLNADLPALQEFILPGGSTLLAYIHLARTCCRRVERSFVQLQQLEAVNPITLMYLNRLSDLFFVVARFIAKQTKQTEVYWQSSFSRIKPD